MYNQVCATSQNGALPDWINETEKKMEYLLNLRFAFEHGHR